MSQPQRAEVLAWRQGHRLPWHSPPHRTGDSGQYLVTAACFEHQPHIGSSPMRLAVFSEQLLETFTQSTALVHGWVVLPNHYHVLASVPDLHQLLARIGQLHGRTAHAWNTEQAQRGRKVWYRCAETAIKSEGHFWATLNYVHHNPVHHGYAQQWTDWPFSSAAEYLAHNGREYAAAIWQQFPILGYGRAWDPANL